MSRNLALILQRSVKIHGQSFSFRLNTYSPSVTLILTSAFAQSAGDIEYTDCTSESPVYDPKHSDCGALGNTGHPFIAIPLRSILARRGSTWKGPFYGFNRTNGVLMLKGIVWLNWIAWNRNVLTIKPYFDLNCVLMLNWIIWNWTVFDIESILTLNSNTRTIHLSTTPSLSQIIWPRWTSRQFLSLLIIQTMLPVTFGYSLSSVAIVMRQSRRWKRLWRWSLTRSHKRILWGLPEVDGTVNRCIPAIGDYFAGDLSFLCVISIKLPLRKKSGNLFNEPRIYIYIYVCVCVNEDFVVTIVTYIGIQSIKSHRFQLIT